MASMAAMELSYETLEKLSVRRPVDRLQSISEQCTGRVVLDLGCLDETALIKRDTEHWLHGRIARLATRVLGIDASSAIPDEGLRTAANATIHRGDVLQLDDKLLGGQTFDVIVAGELIEHLECPLGFLRALKERFPGHVLLLSTPNGVSFANTLLGTIGREVQHRDHLQVFTYKTLHTLCRRSGCTEWDITPYRFYATEMILGSRGLKRAAARATEFVIRLVEWAFPLLSFGYVVRIRL